MPRRGTSNSSPGRSISFTDRGSASGSTRLKQTLSQLTPQRPGLLSSTSVTATEHWRPTLHWSTTMDHPHFAADSWSDQARRKNLHLLAYNPRFLILPCVEIPHLASHLLARMTRMLSGEWERAYGHPIYFVETFIDP